MDKIQLVKKLFSRIRLSEEPLSTGNRVRNNLAREQFKDTMLRNGVLVCESVTPALEKRVNRVISNLGLPRSCTTVFVHSDSEIQADCMNFRHHECVVRLSSGLVNLMNEDEFNFVLGHEIGHFLLEHDSCAEQNSKYSLESFMIRRARELSADRIGYLAIGQIDKSIQAIMKSASGLDSKFLRFDVSEFISQTKKITKPSEGESRNSTHPSMLIRCRALLWFSMIIKSVEDLKQADNNKLAEIDEKVLIDLEKFVDGHVRYRKKELLKNITLWKSTLLVFHLGSFPKILQERIENFFGIEILDSVTAFFKLYEKHQLSNEITKRLDMELTTAYREFPSHGKRMENDGFKKAYELVRDYV